MNAVRCRVVAQLRNVFDELARTVARGLGIEELPEPLPKVLKRNPKAEVERSAFLSLLARPGSEGIKTRKVALLLAEGSDLAAAAAIHGQLSAQGAIPRFLGTTVGRISGRGDDNVEIEASMETMPSVLWDAVVVAGGGEALSQSGRAIQFLKDQYRHCKPMLFLGDSQALLQRIGIEDDEAEDDPGLLVYDGGAADEALNEFVQAMTKHRHFERETDPPRI